MNLISFGLIFTGVMLNAAAQILMKAGTNSIGYFEFSMENILPIGLETGDRVAHRRRAVLLCAERGHLGTRAVACAGQHCFPDAVDGLCGECHRCLVSAWRSLQSDQAGRHGCDNTWRDYYFAGIKIQFSSPCCVAHKKLLLTYYKYAASQFFARALPSL